jgi:outer membrane protein TolC
MNKCKIVLAALLFLVWFCPEILNSQSTQKVLSLDDVLRLARDQSPQALLSRHKYRSSYWAYRSFNAKYLPNLGLNATLPDFNRSISNITLPDGSEAFVKQQLMNNYGTLNLQQNIGLTGGNIYMSSDLARIDLLGDKTHSFSSTPVRIGISQPLLSYNAMRWERKIEPLKYEEAKKSYIKSMEDVSRSAIDFFFDLAQSQLILQISNVNYFNADTLYKIAKGRYNIGTIAENELLQMELSLLNAGTQLTEAKIDLELKKSRLRSFLGYNESVEIILQIPTMIPKLKVEYERVYNEAMKNNPDILDMDRQILEAMQNVAQARAAKRLNATLNASYGLTQTAAQFNAVYANPIDQEMLRIGIQVPILDWGMRRGQFKMAQSNEEVVRTQVKQAQIDFQQNVFLQVMRFNVQDRQFFAAAKADTVAQLRYELSKQRFMIGKIDVLNLNVSLTDKDAAKRAYIEALHTYWSYYFTIRQISLFDFEANKPLEADLDSLLN